MRANPKVRATKLSIDVATDLRDLATKLAEVYQYLIAQNGADTLIDATVANRAASTLLGVLPELQAMTHRMAKRLADDSHA